MRSCRTLPALALLLLLLLPPGARAEGERTIALALLKFGTVGWEIDTLRRSGLDAKHGFSLDVREVAGNEAAKIALQTGAVDMIVSDWIWVARQRAAGEDLVFIPYSRAVGALMVPKDSLIAGLRDLPGKRLGVAGGALDKSWLVFRALCMKALGAGPCATIEPVYAAPPLLNAELLAGRIDAALTNWNYAALLEAAGARPLLSVSAMLKQLGLAADVPMLGYVFRARWAAAHPDLVADFTAASRETKATLAVSDAAWDALAPLLGTDDPAERAALRDGYREGIPLRWGERERQSAADLYRILVEIGGRDLVGDGLAFDPEVFWHGVSY